MCYSRSASRTRPSRGGSLELCRATAPPLEYCVRYYYVGVWPFSSDVYPRLDVTGLDGFVSLISCSTNRLVWWSPAGGLRMSSMRMFSGVNPIGHSPIALWRQSRMRFTYCSSSSCGCLSFGWCYLLGFGFSGALARVAELRRPGGSGGLPPSVLLRRFAPSFGEGADLCLGTWCSG